MGGGRGSFRPILLKKPGCSDFSLGEKHESAISTGFELQTALKTRRFRPYPRRWRVLQRNRPEADIG